MANTLMSLLVSVGIDTADFQKGIAGAEKSALAFGDKMTNIGKNLTRLGAGMTVGLTVPIVAFGASAVKSAQDAELALADLEAVLKSTGSTAGITLKELTDNAAALQKITKFSDEAVMSAQGMLLTFTNIGKDIFPAATEATLDMAQKFGMDASQAAITLGKALNDPIQGVTALRRIGVMLTDQQEAQIKSFMAVGDIASAQKIIMKELAVEIGGVAQAAGATSSGQFAQFVNQLDDLKEIVGAALIPVMLRFISAITPMIESFASAPPAVQNTIISLVALLAAAGPVITVLGSLATFAGALGAGGSLAGIGTVITGTLLPALGGLFTFITATAIPAIAAFAVANAAWLIPLAATVAAVYLMVEAFKNWSSIVTTFKQLMFIMWTGIQIGAKNAVAPIKFIWDLFIKMFNSVGAGVNWLVSKINSLGASLSRLKLPSWLTPGSPTPFEIGLVGIAKAMSTVSSASSVMGKGLQMSAGLPSMSTGAQTATPSAGIFRNMGERTSIPAASSGAQPMNIVINNPKKETSEESIRRTMKSLSYMGVIPT